VTALVLAIGVLPKLSLAAEPKLSLGEDATIRIPFGSTDGMVQVLMKAENLTADVIGDAKDPVLKDLGSAGEPISTTVAFENPVAVDVSATSRAWLWTARISKLEPNSNQKRSASLSFGKVQQYIGYTITNLSPTAFTWSLAAPGVPWLVWFGYPGTQRATPVVVTTGDYPATGFRLSQTTLRDGVGTSQIALEDLELCETVNGPCSSFNIAPRSNRTFYVRLKEKAGHGIWQGGKYTGTLSFAVNERPELQTINVTLQASSFRAKDLGIGLVAIGIIVAWFTSVWMRARMLRLEAQRPIGILNESVQMLIEEIDGAKKIQGVNQELTKKTLNSIQNSLTVKKLDDFGLLPPKMPGIKSGEADTTAKLKEYLSRKSELVDCLTLVICNGMRKLWKEWRDGLDARIEKAIKDALNELDDIGGQVETEVTTRADAKQKVDKVLQDYHATKNALRIQADASLMKEAKPGVVEVTWQIAKLSGVMWLVWGILTLIVGVAVLVVTNPGFGTFLDLVFCLLWGFGFPTGIDKLQQLGPGSIATTIGLPSLPKANP